MASSQSLISGQHFIFQFPSTILQLPKTPFSINKKTSNFSSPSRTRSASNLKLQLKHRILRVASEDQLPSELIEDPKFVPLNSEDPKYGPPVSSGIIIAGISGGRGSQGNLCGIYMSSIQQLLKELDGEFVEIVFCTEDMINQSLWEAVNTKQSNLEASIKIAVAVPRICFLSGLTGEEMMMFIDAFPETGLEAPAFAALVPNSADKPIAELIEEIMGDHEMLSARQTR
ncbi:hypothetical protein ACJIZ3_022880 [Penstemon smallii]|uniref:Uncharacterized protein n=1 Tax=Penstemon smallii TaxID=265156 RepID=A0ABD3TMK3_9LAMI